MFRLNVIYFLVINKLSINIYIQESRIFSTTTFYIDCN